MANKGAEKIPLEPETPPIDTSDNTADLPLSKENASFGKQRDNTESPLKDNASDSKEHTIMGRRDNTESEDAIGIKDKEQIPIDPIDVDVIEESEKQVPEGEAAEAHPPMVNNDVTTKTTETDEKIEATAPEQNNPTAPIPNKEDITHDDTPSEYEPPDGGDNFRDYPSQAVGPKANDPLYPGDLDGKDASRRSLQQYLDPTPCAVAQRSLIVARSGVAPPSPKGLALLNPYFDQHGGARPKVLPTDTGTKKEKKRKKSASHGAHDDSAAEKSPQRNEKRSASQPEDAQSSTSRAARESPNRGRPWPSSGSENSAVSVLTPSEEQTVGGANEIVAAVATPSAEIVADGGGEKSTRDTPTPDSGVGSCEASPELFPLAEHATQRHTWQETATLVIVLIAIITAAFMPTTDSMSGSVIGFRNKSESHKEPQSTNQAAVYEDNSPSGSFLGDGRERPPSPKYDPNVGARPREPRPQTRLFRSRSKRAKEKSPTHAADTRENEFQNRRENCAESQEPNQTPSSCEGNPQASTSSSTIPTASRKGARRGTNTTAAGTANTTTASTCNTKSPPERVCCPGWGFRISSKCILVEPDPTPSEDPSITTGEQPTAQRTFTSDGLGDNVRFALPTVVLEELPPDPSHDIVVDLQNRHVISTDPRREIYGASNLQNRHSDGNQDSGATGQAAGQQNLPSQELMHHILHGCNLCGGQGRSGQERICLICRRNPANVLLFNCHHVDVCSSCVTTIMWCPRCRQFILCHYTLPDP